MSDTNGQIVHRIVDRAWNEQDFDGLDDAIAPGATFHFRGATHPTDLDDLKSLVAAWHEAFPDFHMTAHETVAEGDLVAVRLIYTGTHLGPWKGRPASGARIEVDEMLFFQFEDGRIARVWEVADEHAMWQQIDAAGD